MNVFRLAHRLHKTPEEIRAMSWDDYLTFLAYFRLEAEQQE